jgi:tRNA(fMet)-specific endonuclease VapC
MYILDTDTLTHLHSGNPNVVENLKAIEDIDVRITIITKIEILRGRFDFLMKASDKSQIIKAQMLLYRTEKLLSQLQILALDEKAVSNFEKLQRNSKLRKIARADILIASIALANRATLVTRNIKHFKLISELTVANWVD